MFVFRSPSPEAGTPRAVEQRVADDQTGRDALGDVAGDAAVVVGEPVQLEVLDQAVEADRDARRPLEDLGRDLARDRVDAGLGEIEGRADLVALALDRGCVRRLDPLDEVVDLEHLDVRAGLRVHLREVGVQVEHPRIRVAEEAEARGPQAAHRVRGIEPFAQHVPRRVAVEQRARDGAVRDARARERAGDLGHAAGRAVRQPFAGRHRLVVERPRRLQIEDDDGRTDRLHGGQHLRRRRVRRRIEQHEVTRSRSRSSGSACSSTRSPVSKRRRPCRRKCRGSAAVQLGRQADGVGGGLDGERRVVDGDHRPAARW